MIGEIVGLIGLLLTFAALLFAVWQLLLARNQTNDLLAIKDGLATRHVGEFPEFNIEIARLIQRARSRVDVLCDLPAYGMISGAGAWFEIESAVRAKLHEGVEVSLAVYDSRRRREIIEEQAGFQESIFTDREAMEAVSRIVERQRDGRSAEEVLRDKKVYVDVSLKEHKRVLDDVFNGAELFELKQHIPMYFWMIDRREAIVSIPIFGDDSTEHGFMTRDGSFVRALIAMRNRYLRVAGKL